MHICIMLFSSDVSFDPLCAYGKHVHLFFQHQDMEMKSSFITIVAVYTDGKYNSAYTPIREQMNMYAVFLCGSYPYHL